MTVLFGFYKLDGMAVGILHKHFPGESKLEPYIRRAELLLDTHYFATHYRILDSIALFHLEVILLFHRAVVNTGLRPDSRSSGRIPIRIARMSEEFTGLFTLIILNRQQARYPLSRPHCRPVLHSGKTDFIPESSLVCPFV
jgi:hypothetical protein